MEGREPPLDDGEDNIPLFMLLFAKEMESFFPSPIPAIFGPFSGNVMISFFSSSISGRLSQSDGDVLKGWKGGKT